MKLLPLFASGAARVRRASWPASWFAELRGGTVSIHKGDPSPTTAPLSYWRADRFADWVAA